MTMFSASWRSAERDDLCVGNAVNNLITWAGGADRLTDNDGNDTLSGAAGNDTLTGGAGDDLIDG